LNWKKSSWAVFSAAGLARRPPQPSPCVSRPASHYLVAVANRRVPPISSVFPQILPCSVPRVLVGKFPSSSWPPVECSHHLNVHLSTCHREPSCRLRCAVASHCRCRYSAAAVAAPARMPTPGARRRGLEQAGSCRPVPSSCCRLMIAGCTITSPPLRRHLPAALLCRRFTIEMPAPGARQRCLEQRLCFLLPCRHRVQPV
jgi:hypothetical protein